MRLFTLLACLLALTVHPHSAQAQSAKTGTEDMQQYTSRLLALNQVRPDANPLYTMGTRALDYRLLDKNRRGLGRVSDLTLGADGKIQSVAAEVIATGFDQVLDFDVVAYNVTPESDAFSISLSRDQVEQNAAELLSGLETAAGEEAGQPITVQSLIGGRVQGDRGHQIGMVQDVVIDDQRRMAVALLITLMGGGKASVAIPYQQDKIQRTGTKATVALSDDQEKLVRGYFKKR